ncbi:hypothetical protein PF010_g18345 [Phytophthora fragariae]|uniref:Uncharacterized protein n=1 Tax=Phytophthora fragariae TaxID=53985 RepID=A0A6G0KKE5_9STRA|nr:hypothetical protein PF003_g25631 [Phytophthora fragariae]KAE9091053.1 hypothetical protein PF010_g18345 [Phytophthora fragariae]
MTQTTAVVAATHSKTCLAALPMSPVFRGLTLREGLAYFTASRLEKSTTIGSQEVRFGAKACYCVSQTVFSEMR